MIRSSARQLMSVSLFGAETLRPFTNTLSLLMKAHPIVTKLIHSDDDLTADLMQTATHCQMIPPSAASLANVDLIVIVPSHAREIPCLLSQFTSYLKDKNASTYPLVLVSAPEASVTFFTPIVHKGLLATGLSYPPSRVMGCVTLSTMRARVALSSFVGKNPFDLDVSVVGGAQGDTCIPLFAPFEHHFGFPRSVSERLTAITHLDSPGLKSTYAEAYATSELIFSILRGLRGDPAVTECVFTENVLQENDFELFQDMLAMKSDTIPKIADESSEASSSASRAQSAVIPEYFTRRVTFGKKGIEHFTPIGPLSDWERQKLSKALPSIQQVLNSAKDYEPDTIASP